MIFMKEGFIKNCMQSPSGYLPGKNSPAQSGLNIGTDALKNRANLYRNCLQKGPN